jgi:hypothetical protein
VISRKILNFAIVVATAAAAAIVGVVAAAFALYALVEQWLGAAGAAAIIALVFALGAAGIAWFVARQSESEPLDDQSMIDRLVAMAKDRPLVAAGAAAAIMTVVLRNPKILSVLMGAVLAALAPKPEK